jgi:hypothetical protein
MKNALFLSFLLFSIRVAEAQPSDQKPPLAIVMGVDCSKTIKDFTPIDQSYYPSLLQALLKIS